MEFKGTKGKWKLIDGWDENGKGCFPSVIIHGDEEQYANSYGRNGITINCSHDQKAESIMANALLISKAPEMLEMLNHVKGYLGSDQRELVEKLINEATNV